jgi:hypothetical protein
MERQRGSDGGLHTMSGTLEGAVGIDGLLARSNWDGSAWSRHAFYHSDGVGNVTALVVPNGVKHKPQGSIRLKRL